MNKILLAIETSCDETAMALVEASGIKNNPSFKVVKNIISSQIEIHKKFGGVVPNLAKREHKKNLPILFKKFGWQVLNKLDFIAITVGPGLDPALWTGIDFAKEIGKKLKKKVVGANHLEGHLYSNWVTQNSKLETRNSIKFPAVVLLVSGGHTMLVLMSSIYKWRVIGETLDDAAGEAFDKVARMLKLPYPGGPEIEKIAKKGDQNKIKFPRPLLNTSGENKYNFSFSGLKTAVFYYLRDQKLKTNNYKLKTNIAASFQSAIVETLVKKTVLLCRESSAKSVLMCGGVAQNRVLRKALQKSAKLLKIGFFAPDGYLNTDNAAMIGVSAIFRIWSKKKLLSLRSQPHLGL